MRNHSLFSQILLLPFQAAKVSHPSTIGIFQTQVPREFLVLHLSPHRDRPALQDFLCEQEQQRKVREREAVWKQVLPWQPGNTAMGSGDTAQVLTTFPKKLMAHKFRNLFC